jgi:hypothetical protein
MAPAFVQTLLGFRGAAPNCADSSSLQSVGIARELFSILGITGTGPAQGQTAGQMLEVGVRDHLLAELPSRAPARIWDVDRRSLITDFQQYAHLARVDTLIRNDPTKTLSVEVGRDYLVRPDVTVGILAGAPPQILHAAISCKFTIRSDRVQNIRHEGVILTRHRRGRQPHIVTVTSEPLPSRLAAIARGTGEVDAVYHVALAELVQAVNAVGGAEQRDILDEITGQRRLFDFDELVETLII